MFYLLLRVFLLKKNRNPGSTPDLDPDFSYPFSLPYQLNIDCFSTMQVSNRFLLIAVLFGATVAKPTLTNCLNYIVTSTIHKYSTRTKTLYRLPKPRTEAMRRTFFYSTVKELNALNLEPTTSFSLLHFSQTCEL